MPKRKRPRCNALTAAGDQCQKRAAAGSRKCGVHGGARRKVGAPTKISVEIIQAVTKALRTGASYDVAAQAAGIHRVTIIAWRERGEADLEAGTDSLFAYFADEATRAIAAGEAELVRQIARDPDWRAKAWLLERRHRERWARSDRLDVTLPDELKPRTVEPEPSARDAIVAILRDATAPPTQEENTAP